MLATTTKFKLKGWQVLPLFMVLTLRIILQGWRSKGLVRMQIRFFQLRTLTVWKNIWDMQRFRDSGFHRHAMYQVKEFGTIEVATWGTETLPTWEDAIEKLSKPFPDIN